MPGQRQVGSKSTTNKAEKPVEEIVVKDAEIVTETQAPVVEQVETVVEEQDNNDGAVVEIPTQPEQDKSNQALKEQVEQKETLEKQLKNVAVAQVQDKKVTLVKVKFIKNHIFNRGIEKHSCKVGDIAEVEPHLANKFVQRQLAYILG